MPKRRWMWVACHGGTAGAWRRNLTDSNRGLLFVSPHALRDFWANADTVLGRISRIFFLGFNLTSACFDLVKQNVSSRVNFSLLKNMARHSGCKSESNNPGRLCLEHDLCLKFFMTLRTSIGFTNIESSLRSVCSLGVSEEMEGRISRKEFSKSSPLHLWEAVIWILTVSLDHAPSRIQQSTQSLSSSWLTISHWLPSLLSQSDFSYRWNQLYLVLLLVNIDAHFPSTCPVSQMKSFLRLTVWCQSPCTKVCWTGGDTGGWHFF